MFNGIKEEQLTRSACVRFHKLDVPWARYFVDMYARVVDDWDVTSKSRK